MKIQSNLLLSKHIGVNLNHRLLKINTKEICFLNPIEGIEGIVFERKDKNPCIVIIKYNAKVIGELHIKSIGEVEDVSLSEDDEIHQIVFVKKFEVSNVFI